MGCLFGGGDDFGGTSLLFFFLLLVCLFCNCSDRGGCCS